VKGQVVCWKYSSRIDAAFSSYRLSVHSQFLPGFSFCLQPFTFRKAFALWLSRVIIIIIIIIIYVVVLSLAFRMNSGFNLVRVFVI
jgi:membrane glycosyltransferase